MVFRGHKNEKLVSSMGSGGVQKKVINFWQAMRVPFQ
jgi:hypothetical protein